MEYEGEEQDQGELAERAPEIVTLEDELQDMEEDDLDDDIEHEADDEELLALKGAPGANGEGGLDETITQVGDSQRQIEFRVNVRALPFFTIR